MPNNFKLRGDYYVSKAGNDANDGLTPETPKLTIQAALNLVTSGNRTIIVGSGVYSEGISSTAPLVSTIYLVADGNCVFQGQFGSSVGRFALSVFASGAGAFTITGFQFRDYNNILFFAPINSGNGTFIFQNCIFRNCQFSTPTAVGASCTVTFIKSVFINSKLSKLNLGNPSTAITNQFTFCYLDTCVVINSSFISIINSTVGAGGVGLNTGCLDGIKNTYVDANSVFSIHAIVNVSNNTFNSSQNVNNYINNNIQGKIICDWTGSVSGNSSTGVALDLAQHRLDYPTFNVNSFSADPKFNNPRLLDFTLQTGSPNVSASSDFVSNIGGTEYAVTYTASSAAFTTNATSQSLEYRGIYYGISGSATTGSITSGPMFLQWPRVKPLTSVNWIGALEFNKTITASLAGNNNVPAYTTFTSASGLAGANPDRLKIRLRYSTQETQPSTDSEWDNNGYWPAGTYQLFEINQKPKVDYKGTGNGDPTYVETSAIGDLVPSWIQTEIILRNDYNL